MESVFFFEHMSPTTGTREGSRAMRACHRYETRRSATGSISMVPLCTCEWLKSVFWVQPDNSQVTSPQKKMVVGIGRSDRVSRAPLRYGRSGEVAFTTSTQQRSTCSCWNATEARFSIPSLKRPGRPGSRARTARAVSLRTGPTKATVSSSLRGRFLSRIRLPPLYGLEAGLFTTTPELIQLL